jgi:hypothetical protein
MLKEYYIRRPQLVDCNRLAKCMRQEDRQECWDNGHSPFRALTKALNNAESSTYMLVCVTSPQDGVIDERVVGMWGAGLIKGEGIIWSLWSTLELSDKRFIWKWMTPWIRRCMKDVGIKQAHNVVWSDNRIAMEWIERSGCFELDLKDATMLNGRMYFRFHTKPDLIERVLSKEDPS